MIELENGTTDRIVLCTGRESAIHAIVACELVVVLRHKARTMASSTYALIVKALVQPANANETKQEENFILFLASTRCYQPLVC